MVLEARAVEEEEEANWHKAQIRQEEVLGTKTSWRTLFLQLGSLFLPPILSFPKMVRRGDLSRTVTSSSLTTCLLRPRQIGSDSTRDDFFLPPSSCSFDASGEKDRRRRMGRQSPPSLHRFVGRSNLLLRR